MRFILTLLSAVVLAASLVACSDEPEAPATPETPPVAEAPKPKPTIPAAPGRPPSGITGANGPVFDKELSEGLDYILNLGIRSPQNKARDLYRHPRETLTFFGLQSKMTVIEITPGSGWYTEILSPLMKKEGKYVAAVWDPQLEVSAGAAKQFREYAAKLRTQPKYYHGTEVRRFDPRAPSFGAAGSADMVLTFRNAHNWVEEGTAPAYFKAIANVLKSGGVLGLVDHRAATGAATDGKLGYVTEEQIIDMAIAAGLVLAEKSEINANPEDTKDYVDGVWTLPPTLALGDQDRQKYLDIGESDRMTLKFLKP